MDDEGNGVVLSVQESRSIPEGTHAGIISGIGTRESKYGTYVDISVDLYDTEKETPEVLTTLDAGYPAKISTDTWLGQVLERFGVDLENIGQGVDLVDVLEGEVVQFETQDEQTENGTFAEIMKQTLRPHPNLSAEDLGR